MINYFKLWNNYFRLWNKKSIIQISKANLKHLIYPILHKITYKL